MSVRDIPELFGKNKRLMLLYPSVAYGYLFHISGNLWFAGLTVVCLISPAFDFSLVYYHGIDEISKYGGWMPKRIALIGALLYVPLGLLHISAVIALAWYMDHTDYIMVVLFFTGIFIAMIIVVGTRLNPLAQEIEDITDSAYSKRDRK